MLRAERRSAQPGGSPARAENRARDAHHRGLRAGAAGHPAAGARHLRAGLRELGWLEQAERATQTRQTAQAEQRVQTAQTAQAEQEQEQKEQEEEEGQEEPSGAQQLGEAHHALAARLLMSLAHLEAEQGRTDYGLRLLDQAEGLAAADDRGVLLSQRGLLLMRTGQGADALKMLDEAVLLLADHAEPAVLARVLLNRGVLQLTTGHVRRARADLRSCQRIAADDGLDLIAAKAMHNQGYCDLLAGDIPAALHLFNAAADAYRQNAPGCLPVLAMDRARALLAAGLAADAATELDNAISSFRRQRLEQDQAEAELARSQAALGAGDHAAARRWAATAGRRFRRRGNDAWAAVAELTRLRARSASAGRPGSTAAEAVRLAERLRGCGLSGDAAVAELIAARGMLAAGRRREAERRIAAVRCRGQAVSLDVSLLRRLARAELAERSGRTGAALAELRAGLATVHTRRGRLGSLDLQTGAAALGAELAAAGLRLALDRGSAPLLFAWLERSRAQAFRIRPVRPPTDPRAAAAAAELRQLSHLIRSAELNGRRDPASVARRAELQRGLREHSWQADGDGRTSAQASLAEVIAALSESRQGLVSILAQGGRLLGVAVSKKSARLIELGDFEAAAEAARRLSADLDTLAGRRLPARLEAVIRESIRHQTELLTAEIMAPLRHWLGEDGVVLVPAGALASIPWSLLPDLRGRPVTVCPSASAWLAAWRRGQGAAGEVGTNPPILVAGPDLRHAPKEIVEIAKVYPGCRPLLAEAATVDATLHALDGAPIAHLAAHGHHDRENVLFSRLDLADGPLMAYDIQRLAAAPRQVILSACDVGRAVVRPGDELLGFTAALLYAGTASVISSVTRVPDDATVGVMTAYHRALTAGARPAEALAGAAMAEPFSPFVCFGSG
jgi:CHAT domain-containing protein